MADVRYPDSGRAIKTARKNARPPITQESLADTVGITRRHMIRLENGEHRPSVEIRNRIAEACRVAPESLPAEDEESPLRAAASSTDDVLFALSRLIEAAKELGGVDAVESIADAHRSHVRELLRRNVA